MREIELKVISLKCNEREKGGVCCLWIDLVFSEGLQ